MRGMRMLTRLSLTGMILVGLVMPRAASATTADGTLITNVATATFATASLNGFGVSYGASAYVIVANPCVAIMKVPDVTTQSAGSKVTYTLWIANCSPTSSAFNITITDKLPDNVSYDAARGSWNGGSGGTWTSSESVNGSVGSYVTGTPTAGQTTPYYLRYVLDLLGPAKSAMLAYSVVIL
jgi:uncharacterized repeat protein (TIGR01451 family)